MTIIFTLISLFLGIFIILKYFRYKRTELLFAGITLCLIMSPFWGDIVSYLWYLFFNIILSDFLYFMLTLGLIPLAHVTWMLFFTSFFLKEKRKVIVGIFFLEAILIEIFFIYFLIVEPSLIATRIPLTRVEWTLWIIIYFLISILLFLTTGIAFTRQSFKSDNKETKLKGKILLIAFISFMVGILIEIFPLFFAFKYVLARLIILTAAIEFYIGFILPEKIKKMFTK